MPKNSTSFAVPGGDYFAQVPQSVLRNEQLSPAAKLLYAILLSYPAGDSMCFPGQACLARQLNACEKTVRKAIKELCQAALLAVKRRGQGKTNIYEVVRLELKSNKCTESTTLPDKERSLDSTRTVSKGYKVYSGSNNKDNRLKSPYRDFTKNNRGNLSHKPVDFSKFEPGGKFAHLVSR